MDSTRCSRRCRCRRVCRWRPWASTTRRTPRTSPFAFSRGESGLGAPLLLSFFATQTKTHVILSERVSASEGPAFNREWLEESDLPSDRLDQLARVIAHSLFEHQRDVRDIGNAGRGITVDYHEVGLLVHPNGADAICSAEVRRAVQRADLDCLERRQAALDEQLGLALVGVAGDHATAARRVRP